MNSELQVDSNFPAINAPAIVNPHAGLNQGFEITKSSQQLYASGIPLHSSEETLSQHLADRRSDFLGLSQANRPVAVTGESNLIHADTSRIISGYSYSSTIRYNTVNSTFSKSDKSDQLIDRLTGIDQRQHFVGQVENGHQGTTDPFTRVLQVAAPAFPGRLLRYVPGHPLIQGGDVRQWQAQMQKRGWRIDVDGIYGRQSATVCKQFQQEKGLHVDGIVGSRTWNAAFTLPIESSPSSSGGTGTINSKGLALVKEFEGLRLKAYRDPDGRWTIGYGHTGSEVGSGDVITAKQAEALLSKDLNKFETVVHSAVKVKLNSNQFSALVSFTYNEGPGNLKSSTLLKKLNQRDYQGAANEFLRWNKGDGGRVLPGLTRRRAAERKLFLTPSQAA